MRRWILLILLCGWAAPVFAQQAITLRDDITSSGDAVTLNRIQGYGSARIQVTGTYDTTWEVQCSVDGSTFDTDDEVLIVKEGETGAVSEVTDDAVAIWRVSDIAGCSSIRVIATAYASGTQSVVITATEAGGGGGGAGGGGGGNGAIADGVDGNLLASVFDYTSAKPLAVRLTDTDGNYVGAGAGTQYAEDSAAAANPTGTALNLIRADALAALTSADGDNLAARGTDKGELYVKHVDSIPVTATNLDVQIGGSDTVTVTATNLDVQSGGADIATSTQASAIQAAVELLDNAISGAGFNITQFGGTNVSTGNGTVDAGTIRVNLTSNGTGVVGVTQATASNLNAQVVGNIAHDTAASGNPVQVAGFAASSAPTNVSANDVARIWTSLFGAVNVILRDTSGNAVSAGGIAQQDETAFTTGTTSFTPVGGVMDDTSPDTIDEGEAGVARMTSGRALHVNLRDSSGNELESATDATHDSAAPADGPLGMAEFDDSSPDSVDEGDAGRLRISANRNLYSTIRDAAGNERGANVNASNELLVAVSSVPSHAVTNAGTFVVQENGAALTALQLLDNIVGVEDAAETAGGGLSMAGSVRRDAAATSAGTTGDNATVNTDALGLLWTRFLDPCSGVAKTYIPIDIVTATTTEITPSLAGASTHYYVCSINIGPTAAAQNIALVDDDTDNCASVTSGVAGGTTAGEGWNIAANGGLAIGNGLGAIARTNGTNRVLCLVTSAAVQTSGVITVAAAP